MWGRRPNDWRAGREGEKLEANVSDAFIETITVIILVKQNQLNRLEA